MPQEFIGLLFLIGALFLLIALMGSIEIRQININIGTRNPPLRIVLAILGIILIILSIVFYTVEEGLIQPSPNRNSDNPTVEPALAFAQLSEFLDNGNFKSADLETDTIISAKKYSTSCEDLRKLDEIWRRHSDYKFGFKAQLDIWNEEKRDINRFRDRVGWRVNGRLISHDELTFSLNAPTGHLPWVGFIRHEKFLPIVNECWRN
jgi:hypothetical protein